MKTTILSFLTLISVCFSYTQDVNEAIGFIVENDKMVLLDRYYTSGLFINYKRNLENNFLFKKDSSNTLQLNVTIGNETYTPKNLRSFNTQLFDRPYAGWLFLKTELVKVKRANMLSLGMEIGITGEESLAGKLQTWFHEFLNINDNPTWHQEIEFKFLLNLKTKYILNTQINNKQSLQYIGSASIGTKDIYMEYGIDYFVGKFNALQNTSRLGLIDKTKQNEFFGYLGLAYRYVAHNTLIQGSLDYEDALFTSRIKHHLLKFKVGTVLKIRNSTFKLGYNFNTRETPKAATHAYGTLSFYQSF